MTIQAPTVTVTGSIGAGVGIYPGQWWPTLAPLAFSPSVAIGDSEQSVANLKTTYSRTYDFVGLEVWGGRKLEMQLYQRYRVTTTASDSEPNVHESEVDTILQNRIVYRPIFTSPIMLLLNYEGDRKLNDPTLIASAGPWSDKKTYLSELQWLMRWNQTFTTRSTAMGTLEQTADMYVLNSATSGYDASDHSLYSAYGEFQIRIYPLAEVSALYVYQTSGVKRWFGSGTGAYEAWELLPAAGVIWRMGDKAYLDGSFTYDYRYCMAGTACASLSSVLPHLYFTMNL
jgi:hypothetical protein